MKGCQDVQEESFDDFLDLEDDLELDVNLDLSQDFGIEVVGGDITEIIISDDESEVRIPNRACHTKQST